MTSIFSLVVFFAFAIFPWVRDIEGGAMRPQEAGITKKEFTTIVESAKKTARTLGYKIEGLDFELSKEKDLFKVVFFPKPKRGQVTYGGTLTIFLDKSGNTVRFMRGI